MTVELNGQNRKFPTTLSDITIGQRIAFHDKYGRDFEKQLQDIIAMPDGWQKSLSLSLYQDRLAASFVAFFLDVPEPGSLPADVVVSIYATVYAALMEDEKEIEPKYEFTWQDKQWVIASPILSPSSRLQFGELIDAKQIIKDLAEDEGSRWDMLHRLACIFLRLPNEEYEPQFSTEGGRRFELMKDLPLDIALQVGFFLSSWINSYRSTSLFSGHPEGVEAETWLSILTAGAGFTSSSQLPKPKYSTGQAQSSTALRQQGGLKRLMSLFSRVKKRTTAKL